MFEPTGSVYLDTPRRAARPTGAPSTHLPRVQVAGILVTIGLIGLSTVVLLTGLRSLVLEPATVVAALEATLDDPAARAEIESEVASAIEREIVGSELAGAAEYYGLDVAEDARRVSLVVADDPVFRAALTDLVEEIHARAFIEPQVAAIDLAPLSDAILALIRREAPDLAAIIPPGATLWTLDAAVVPDLTGPAGVADRALMVALAVTAALPLAALLHPSRHRVAAWVGRWALVTGVLGGLAAIGLPHLGGWLSGRVAVEIAIRATSLRLIAPAAVTGIIGMGLVSLAAVVGHREQRRVSDEGAAAALGMDEPPMWPGSNAPELDLAGRGLVDVNHPLTNI